MRRAKCTVPGMLVCVLVAAAALALPGLAAGREATGARGALSASAPQAVPTVQVFPVRNVSLWDAPQVSGSRIVWLQSAADDSNYPELVGTDFLSGADFFIRQISWGDAPPHFSFAGATVVYFYPSSANEIWGYDVMSGVNFPVRGGYKAPRVRFNPQVSGNVVVWQVGSYTGPETISNLDIGGYNLTTRKRLALCQAPGNQVNPSISGKTVVWYDGRGGKSQLYARRLSGGAEFKLCTLQTKRWVDPVVSGNVVVFPDKRGGSWNIYGYDLSKRKVFPICTAAGDQTSPDVSGDLVAWCDTRGGGSLRARLLGGGEFTITSSPTSAPSISGDTVVWATQAYGDATIYRATVLH